MLAGCAEPVLASSRRTEPGVEEHLRQEARRHDPARAPEL